MFGRRTKAKNRSIASLKSVEGVSVTCTKSKLEAHNQHLGRVCVDSDFDNDWKGRKWKLVIRCHLRMPFYIRE